MKQQILEAEIVELKAIIENLRDIRIREYNQKVELTNIVEKQAKRMNEMQQEIDAMKAQQSNTIGHGPAGASVDRERTNGKSNGFVRPVSFFTRLDSDGEPMMLFSDWDDNAGRYKAA